MDISGTALTIWFGFLMLMICQTVMSYRDVARANSIAEQRRAEIRVLIDMLELERLKLCLSATGPIIPEEAKSPLQEDQCSETSPESPPASS